MTAVEAAAGFKGHTGDCVTRAVAIASGIPYQEVYDRMAAGNATQRKTKHTRNRKAAHRKSARGGIYTHRQWFRDYMVSLGFEWTATMQIGSGCTTHLIGTELPKGRIVVSLSRHYAGRNRRRAA